jgi:hypothetical protein
MTIEQDFLLSAFLDGQVDPEEKRRAEAIVASDPAAAETLHSLAVVRDLVASLSRPPAPDVSAEVLRQIAANAGRPRRWKTWAPYVGRSLGASGLAASVALLVFMGSQVRSRRLSQEFDIPRTPPPIASAIPASTPPPAPITATATSARTEIADVGPPKPVTSTASTVDPSVAIAAPRPVQFDKPRGFRELWTASGPRRDFVVTPGEGESTTEAVATLLGQSTHRDFYKIVVPAKSGGTPVDGPAVAFAATLDPNEFTTLRRRLESQFGNRVEASDADPEIAGLLADVGHVTAASAAPAADVVIPQNELAALRVSSPSASMPERTVRRTDSATRRLDPEHVDVGPPTPESVDPAEPAVVLIWIVGPGAK